MTKRPDDKEYCDKMLAGDVEAFRLFFRERSPEVVALCWRILHSLPDAEDVTADVFLEVWSKRDRFDASRGTLRSYVLMLARSRAIDLYRVKSKERARVEFTADADTVGSQCQFEPDDSMTEFQLLVKNALAELSDAEQATIELSFFEGLSHSQIANQLDTPLGTIKSSIRRGLSKLRQKLNEWES